MNKNQSQSLEKKTIDSNYQNSFRVGSEDEYKSISHRNLSGSPKADKLAFTAAKSNQQSPDCPNYLNG